MITAIDGHKPVQMDKYQKRDSTFADILNHEIAIRIDKVETPEVRLLWERGKIHPSFDTRILEFARARGVSDACMERLERNLERGEKDGRVGDH